MLQDILYRHLEPEFTMLENIIATCSAELWVSADIWRHVYHTIVSLEFWSNDSTAEFTFETYGKAVHPEFNEPSETFLTKDELLAYFKRLQAKWRQKYAISEELFFQPSKIFAGYTYLDLFLGQLRHIQHHIGYINCLLKQHQETPVKWLGYKEE